LIGILLLIKKNQQWKIMPEILWYTSIPQQFLQSHRLAYSPNDDFTGILEKDNLQSINLLERFLTLIVIVDNF